MQHVLSPAEMRRFITQLISHEGAVRDAKGLHKAYRCSAGALTIGYGHNLDANPIEGIGPTSRIGEVDALAILDGDIAKFETDLQKGMPWCVDLVPARYGVLLNMAFNMGMKGLGGFRNTLADMERGDYKAAANRMLQSRWAAQVGRRAIDLARQMRTGEWS